MKIFPEKFQLPHEAAKSQLFPIQNDAVRKFIKIIFLMNVTASTYAPFIIGNTFALSESAKHSFHMFYF